MGEPLTDDAGSQVPISVLDRVIKLAQENNLAYNQIVSALDSLSSRSVEVSDAVDKLCGTIENEQLADVIRKNLSFLNDEVIKMKECLVLPQYNLLVAMGAVLSFNRTSARTVQQHASSALWFLEVVESNRSGILMVLRIFNHIKQNSTKYAFFGGIALASLLVANGHSVYEIIKALVFK